MVELTQNEATEQQPQPDPLQQRVLAILQGEVPPPNEAIAYFVGRAEAMKAEARATRERIAKAEDQLQALKVHFAEVRGAGVSYAEDIRAVLADPGVIAPEEKRIVVP